MTSPVVEEGFDLWRKVCRIQNNIGGAVTVATFNDDVGMDVMTSGVGVGIKSIDDEGLIDQD